MKSTTLEQDQRAIYFAHKAVKVYKGFKAKYSRATDLVNKHLRKDDTYPPLLRTESVERWRIWKFVIKCMERRIQNKGLEYFEDPKLLNVCIDVSVMVGVDIEDSKKNPSKRIDKGQEQRAASYLPRERGLETPVLPGFRALIQDFDDEPD